ncbi:hypothetical protein FOA43_003334 [Brettanomyces nanus]|uniref:Uncharacterized protein n=1 Tax=Eeniella nana TaxID=13502 RepID=A0A875S4S1_EENNA|nr:uncharacterized protein FOA43_003334 [Brettanomyces nanus]QPG75948.1 hypothetical protein FOA43_003334 [Brettanomyces nanus]
MTPKQRRAPQKEHVEAAEMIVKKYLTEDFDYSKIDFSLLTTMRYDPSLYRGDLPLLDAIYQEPLDESFFFLIENHIRRINIARDFFEITDMGELTKKILLQHVTEAMKGLGLDKVSPYKVRILVDKQGQIHLDLVGPIDIPLNTSLDCATTFTAYLDTKPTVISPFTSFKTTYRKAYNNAKARTVPENTINTDVILYNTAGSITESSFCNVALQRSVKNPLTGQETMRWVTPPLSVGCIEGTFRKYLMDKEILYEAAVSVKSLKNGEVILLFNAVRGIIKAQLVL